MPKTCRISLGQLYMAGCIDNMHQDQTCPSFVALAQQLKVTPPTLREWLKKKGLVVKTALVIEPEVK